MPVIGLPTNHTQVVFGPGGDIVQNVDRSGMLNEFERPNVIGDGSLTIATSKDHARKIIAYANLLRVEGYDTIIPAGPKQEASITENILDVSAIGNGLQQLTLDTLRVEGGRVFVCRVLCRMRSARS